MTPRNWAAFNRRQQDQARRAMAEGQNRPAPLIATPSEQDQDDQSTPDDKQEQPDSE